MKTLQLQIMFLPFSCFALLLIFLCFSLSLFQLIKFHSIFSSIASMSMSVCVLLHVPRCLSSHLTDIQFQSCNNVNSHLPVIIHSVINPIVPMPFHVIMNHVLFQSIAFNPMSLHRFVDFISQNTHSIQ